MSTAQRSTGLLGGSRSRVLVAVAMVGTAVVAAPQPSATGQQAAPDGARLYRTYCASCHGVSGRGDGPMAEYLRVPPTNLTQWARRHGGTFQEDIVARAIDGRDRIGSHGPSDMPVWGDAFTSPLAGGGEPALRDRVRAIVRHLASLQESQAP
jgi:mono/diheme cytochrome c family protein